MTLNLQKMSFLIDAIPIIGATQMYTYLFRVQETWQVNVYCTIRNDGVVTSDNLNFEKYFYIFRRYILASSLKHIFYY